MPSLTNIEVVISYDANAPIQSPDILSASAELEHAAQCVAFETLRTLLSRGYTVQQYNELPEADWQQVITESDGRARLNVAAPVAQLTENQKQAGASYGGNFFETGYSVVVDSVQQGDRVQFTRIGGIN